MKALALCLAIALTSTSCSAVQHGGDGGISWETWVQVGIDIAVAVVPVILHQIDSAPGIPEQTRAAMHHAEQISDDSLAIASTTYQDFLRDRSLGKQCIFRAALDQAIAGRVQVATLLRDIGQPVDPRYVASIGTLGTIADMFMPGCPGGQITARIHAQLAPRRR